MLKIERGLRWDDTLNISACIFFVLFFFSKKKNSAKIPPKNPLLYTSTKGVLRYATKENVIKETTKRKARRDDHQRDDVDAWRNRRERGGGL